MAKGAAAESRIVVLASLAGNLAIAVIKFIAFGMTRSTAMLTEGVHSLVDTLDQALLLIGQARADRPPDENHPFGHGLEIYFWSFVVALMVFLAGGAVSVFEGVQRLQHPTPIESPWVNAWVLGLSVLFEGASFWVAARAAQKVVSKVSPGEGVGLFDFIRRSKDPNLYTSLVENGAALAGLALAALGVAGGAVLHLPWADGAASIAIGLLLMAVAVLLGNETRSLMAGEAVDPAVLAKLRAALDGEHALSGAAEVATLHFGPRTILVAVTGDFVGDPSIEAVSRVLTARLQAVDERVKRVYFRPLPREAAPAVAPAASGAA